MHRQRFLITCICLLLGACNSRMPDQLRNPDVAAISAAQARQQPQQYEGARIRWGGLIMGIENLAQSTRIEVLSRPLDSAGKPQSSAPAGARFMAHYPGFLDPQEYRQQRAITLLGRIAGRHLGKIGEYAYDYPVIEVESLQLWPESSPEPLAYPLFYDPWLHPWYSPWYNPWYRY